MLCRRLNDYFEEQAERAQLKLAAAKKGDVLSTVMAEAKQGMDLKETRSEKRRRKRAKQCPRNTRGLEFLSTEDFLYVLPITAWQWGIL